VHLKKVQFVSLSYGLHFFCASKEKVANCQGLRQQFTLALTSQAYGQFVFWGYPTAGDSP